MGRPARVKIKPLHDGVLDVCFRVNGLRLAYGYYPGWGVDESCQETGGKQELAHLCKLMLKSVDKRHNGFYGVFVSLFFPFFSFW